ncbi:MAG: toll/interleukin-1 receptor domain-containing protein [Isosphaeraceae bacterium]
MAKPKVFVSHIHDEAALAGLIKDDLIDPHLLGSVEVFVSSDQTTNPGGTSWLHNIEDNLLTASVLLIVASPRSINSPWINIEAGAAWLRSLQARSDAALPPVYVMPLCHSGLTPGALPLPWSTFNAVEIRTAGGLQQVLETIALAATIRAPKPGLSSLASNVQSLEAQYTVYAEIEKRISQVLGALGPAAKTIFIQEPPSGQMWIIPDQGVGIIAAVEVPLTWLKSQGYIDYKLGGVRISMGSSGGKQSQDIAIRPSTNFVQGIVPHLRV